MSSKKNIFEKLGLFDKKGVTEDNLMGNHDVESQEIESEATEVQSESIDDKFVGEGAESFNQNNEIPNDFDLNLPYENEANENFDTVSSEITEEAVIENELGQVDIMEGGNDLDEMLDVTFDEESDVLHKNELSLDEMEKALEQLTALDPSEESSEKIAEADVDEEAPHTGFNVEIESTPAIDKFLQRNAGDESVDLDESTNVGKDLFALNDNMQAEQHKPLSSRDFATEDVEKKLDAMIESYERNKLLSIEDIYRKASLVKDIKSTVFMVDVYAKALPENLPVDIKRESVHNIMKASELEVNELLNDAYMRIDSLNKVLESVVKTTEELKAKNDSTISDLEKRIKDLKKSTREREKFQETQNTMIEYEIQRIINIVDFIKPK